MENRDFVDSNRPGFLSLARGERSVVPVAMTSARRARRCTTWLAAAMLSALFAVSQIAVAGEGGTSHIMPGANATLVDLPPTSPGWFFKPMYINYQGDASARVPTAAGVVANLNADANTLVLGGGYGFEQTVLGGAHYAVAAFMPYTWLSISGNSAALGGVQIQNSVSGIGDLTVVPVMLAWKSGDWQYDFLLPVYAPTGSRQTALRVVLAQGPISRASTANYLVHYRTLQGATS